MPVVINGSTGISGTDGSAGTPAVQGTDTNTGMFFPAADEIGFAEGGVEVMRINSAGAVGIGTAAPGQKLEVAGGASQARIRVSGAGSPGYELVDSNTAIVLGGANLMDFYTSGFLRARIQSGGDFSIGTGSSLGKITMLWDNAVQQGLAFSAASGTFNGSPVVFYNSSGGVSGFIGQTASSVSYNTGSDYRLKENVVPLTGATARVQALKPSRFNFIADPDRTVDGFIAHEAAEVVPEAVHGEKDAVNEDGSIKPQGIDQSKLVPLLTAALQEALTEIAALKARVAALEAR